MWRRGLEDDGHQLGATRAVFAQVTAKVLFMLSSIYLSFIRLLGFCSCSVRAAFFLTVQPMANAISRTTIEYALSCKAS